MCKPDSIYVFMNTPERLIHPTGKKSFFGKDKPLTEALLLLRGPIIISYQPPTSF